ncbi:hypothetical protein RF11_16306 [Thelohanellus kitauei]|uniref:Uncharacterized protein n=1 Tax=Thelohanellus kitauei TaxID=669202 RepID=A0A0C2NBB9_THEKT|nr:hypothetical protein RF11_16306 [Thelohanellus kitauei]
MEITSSMLTDTEPSRGQSSYTFRWNNKFDIIITFFHLDKIEDDGVIKFKEVLVYIDKPSNIGDKNTNLAVFHLESFVFEEDDNSFRITNNKELTPFDVPTNKLKFEVLSATLTFIKTKKILTFGKNIL